MSQNVTILGHWNSRKAKSPPSLSWGEERTKILLLACCYQEVRYSRVVKRIGTRGESGGRCGDKFLVRERHQGQRGVGKNHRGRKSGRAEIVSGDRDAVV